MPIDISDFDPNGVFNMNMVSSLPNAAIISQSALFLDGTSSDMAVNGFPTPVDFAVGPPAGQTWYIDFINLNINDVGAKDFQDFTSRTALTFGIDLLVEIGGTEYLIFNAKSNPELTSHMDLLSGEAVGLSANSYNFKRVLKTPTRLLPTEKFIFRVNDDLSGINDMVAGIQYRRAV